MIIHWRRSDGGFRCWKSDWPGDAFEVLNAGEFKILEFIAPKFGIELIEASDED